MLLGFPEDPTDLFKYALEQIETEIVQAVNALKNARSDVRAAEQMLATANRKLLTYKAQITKMLSIEDGVKALHTDWSDEAIASEVKAIKADLK